MDTTSIDHLDRARYNMIKWFTIGWAIWFGTFILKDYLHQKWLIMAVVLFGLAAWVMVVIQHLRILKLGKIINADSRMKDALNDELIQHNRNVSFTLGYKVIMIIVTFFLLLSLFTGISALLVSEIILYAGVLTPLIISLVLNRG